LGTGATLRVFFAAFGVVGFQFEAVAELIENLKR